MGEERTPSFRSDFWAQLAAQEPQVYLPLGDSVYLDYIDRYSDLAAVPGFNDFISRTLAMPIWDDHDFGSDNGGAEFGNRAQYKQMFLDFWSTYGAVPLDSERRFREGNYDAVILGPPGREVQFLMLDVRYFREPAGAMLGEQQWKWLEEQLKKPARLRILQSGSVVLASAGVSGNGQTWSSHTAEQARLFTLLNDMGSTGVIMLSGDVHYSDVSRRQGARYPYLDFTCSSLNQGMAAGTAPGGPLNDHRDTPASAIQESNFGLVRIDWTAMSPLVHIEYRSTWNGCLLLSKALRLADLGES